MRKENLSFNQLHDLGTVNLLSFTDKKYICQVFDT
jgi:hypothetical protein